MFDCFCLDKTDKLLLEESVANEIMSIEESRDKQKMGRKGRLGDLLREVIATDVCPKEHYKIQREMEQAGIEYLKKQNDDNYID